jgi:hypothetical protein
MKLEVFELLITTIAKQSKKSYDTSQLGIDLLDYEEGWLESIGLLFNAYYGKTGADWIDWYLYERPDNAGPTSATNANGEPICYDIPSLWKEVESIRIADDFVEFELPVKTHISEADVRAFFSRRS